MPLILFDPGSAGKRRRTSSAIAAPLLLLVALGPACDRRPRANRTAATAIAVGDEEGPIFIGEVGSMTGPASVVGRALHDGFEAAIDERNACGGIAGRQLAVLTLDDRSRPADARAAVERLEKRERVVAILAAATGDVAAAAAGAAEHVTIVLPDCEGGESGEGAELGRATADLLFDAMARARTFEDADLAAAVRAASARADAPAIADPSGVNPGRPNVFRVRARPGSPIMPRRP